METISLLEQRGLDKFLVCYISNILKFFQIKFIMCVNVYESKSVGSTEIYIFGMLGMGVPQLRSTKCASFVINPFYYLIPALSLVQ